MKNFLLLGSLMLFVASCSTSSGTASTTSSDATAPATTLPFLIGTYTAGSSEGIYAAEFDTTTGNFVNLRLAAYSMDPSFVVPSSDGKYVYGVNEQDGGSVSVFQWNDQGTLDLLETKGSAGIHPCHIAINANNSMISVANYTSGDGALFPVEGGPLGEAVPYSHSGSGPNAQRQEGPHAHFNTFHAPSGRLYVVDLGTDEILKYSPVPGQSELTGTVAHKMEPGDGPRHLDFHPTQPWVFVVNELSNTIMSFRIDASGDFEPISRLSTLPDGFTDFSKAADIHVSPDGRFVYSSNRGFHSLAIYQILEDGSLTFVGFESRGIDTPRNFAITPDGSFILVANQESDSIVAFRVDQSDGTLTPFGTPITLSKPVCLKFY